MSVRRTLMFVAMAVLSGPGLALAQGAALPTGSTQNWVGPFAALAAGIGFGIAAGLCGLGQGRATGRAVAAMAREPGNTNPNQPAVVLGLASIDASALVVF